MRIGMILDKSFPPDPRVENEARMLMDDGHQLFLFCLDFGGITDVEEINEIKVRRYGSTNFEYRMSALSYTLPLYSWMLRGRIERFLRDNDIQVMHVHDMVVAEASIKANRSLGLPMVLDLHENRPEIMALYPHLQRFPGKHLVSIKKWKRMEEKLTRAFDLTVVVTEHARKDLTERAGVEESRILVMPNTVRPEFFSKAELDDGLVNRFRGDFTLLYLGDTGLRRGLMTAIDAVRILKSRIPEIKLVIVGSNTTDQLLKNRVKELNLQDQVSFEGWQDEKRFPSYLSAADVCISPLHRNKHHDTTLANKIFQYMAFSKPILASDATAQEDIIQLASCGVVHRAEDSEDFAEKCLSLYDDQNRRRTLGENGKRFLDTEFSLEKTGKPLREFYRSLEQSVEA